MGSVVCLRPFDTLLYAVERTAQCLRHGHSVTVVLTRSRLAAGLSLGLEL
jgi:hypothetical protein